MITRSITQLLTLVLGLFMLTQAQAGQTDFGKYQVHWSVFPSTFLDPQVAKDNNLQRSRSIGIINISIMTEGEHGQIRPVGGQVEGQVSNDIQQVNFLAFRRIQEGDAVYFIAQYQYRTGDLMTFNLKARPAGHNQDLQVRFSHTLFND
ncbi:DUF4426 domain-containing protein [Marinobacter halophilus]|uniref:DUF4426 domain-containing protein n=1 Tax=Marinobacter halophilus TaxID=1323740 RepID=A0A2T1KJL3_9GAMM|nr:DUF4426 domain-containing protein [Marinobacter halophilus]PSF10356.1 DUF4426 domain-containing protein [Marinobacter halophilus]GGC70017.1 hypothetical protein GCM10011362_18190 [Marinobacter halophilus]